MAIFIRMSITHGREKELMPNHEFVKQPIWLAHSSVSGLHGTGRNHLLSEMVLVLRNAALPSRAGLILTHHDVFGDLVKESVLMLVQA